MIIYSFDGKEFDNKLDLEEYINDVAEDSYDDMLDDVYEEVKICGWSYSPSLALYRVDPVAYNCGLNDYKSSLYDEVEEIYYEEDADDEEEEV